MTTNDLLENINNKVHEFDFSYITYHSLMEGISECIKEYEKDYPWQMNKKLKQENDNLKHMLMQILNESTGRNNGMGMQRSYKLVYTQEVYDDIYEVIRGGV